MFQMQSIGKEKVLFFFKKKKPATREKIFDQDEIMQNILILNSKRTYFKVGLRLYLMDLVHFSPFLKLPNQKELKKTLTGVHSLTGQVHHYMQNR